MRVIEQQNNVSTTTETVAVEYSWQYSRQQSIQDDSRRKELKVLIVWAGGIGSNSTYVLAKQWIENIKVVDFDTVELENTGSQLYNLSNVWQPKVEALQKNIKEFNVALYCVDNKLLFETLDKINNNNNAAEYYLTDIVEILGENYNVDSYIVPNDYRVQGFNDVESLKAAELEYLNAHK